MHFHQFVLWSSCRPIESDGASSSVESLYAKGFVVGSFKVAHKSSDSGNGSL